MGRNPILEEIHAAREMLLAEHNGDVHAYVLNARQRALASGRPIAAPKQRASASHEATAGVSAAQSPPSASGGS